MEIEVKSLLGSLDHPNRNGRIYDSKNILHAIQEWKKDGQPLVELNPKYENFDCDTLSEITLSNVCGLTKDIWEHDGEIYGKIELLNTPSGKIVENIANANLLDSLHLSPRMTGDIEPVYTIDENGNKIQETDENGNPISKVINVKVISFDLL